MAVLRTSEITFWKRRLRSIRRRAPRDLVKQLTPKLANFPSRTSVGEHPIERFDHENMKPESTATDFSIRWPGQISLLRRFYEVKGSYSTLPSLFTPFSGQRSSIGWSGQQRRHQFRIMAMVCATFLFAWGTVSGGIAMLLFGLLISGERRR
jgi:hypothetical protein